MEHSGDLSAIALVASIAVLGGLLLTRLRQPAIVGYILVGIVLGPGGFIQPTSALTTMAELGVIMLLFLIGMELSLRAFVAVLQTAVLCALLQIAASVGFAVGLAQLIGKPISAGVLFGCIISLSSTAVAVKMLEDLRQLRTEIGRITRGGADRSGSGGGPDADRAGGAWRRGRLLLHRAAEADAGNGHFGQHHLGAEPPPSPRPADAPLVERPYRRHPPGRPGVLLAAAALSGALGLSTAFGAFLAGLLIGNSTDRAATVRATQPI